MKNQCFTFFILFLITQQLCAQGIPIVELPRVSQQAQITQRVGITDISIRYHRPALNKRTIHQKSIAPYGKIWRAGANENTIIEFSHAVKVEGQTIAAGKYGLHMIPGKEKWILIFSANATSWGSFYYKKAEDALRIEVTPQTTVYKEWLTYEFSECREKSTKVSLLWGKVQVSFEIQVDVPKIVVANLRRQMRNLAGYFWEGPYMAARYCSDQKVNTPEALTWINRSIGIQKNFQNMLIKSKLLAQAGKMQASKTTKEEALAMADERALINYGYSLTGDNKKPYDFFDYIVQRFKTWTAYRAQAIVYRYFGEKDKARKSFEMALKKAPQDQKAALQKALAGL